MKTALSILVVGSVLGLGLSLTAISMTDGAVERGKEVYAEQKCAICHSIAGIGGKKLALDGVGSKLKAEDIKKWIQTPKEMKPGTTMKPYPNLPEKDVNALASYVLTLR
jgi:mono/diheme cytochrome c family protein